MAARLASLIVAIALTAASADENATRAEYRAAPENPFVKHAPLAMFSLGSLAVGAAIYGIQNSMGAGPSAPRAADRSSVNMAVLAAGATSLAAGVTYFYYARRDAKRAEEWDASVSGGIAPDGSMRVVATLPLPLYFKL